MYSPPSLIGMIHVGALPGTPFASEPLSEIISRAVDEARIYAAAGVTQICIENMHDRPYLSGGVGPEIVATMTAIGCAVRAAATIPLGVQVLAGANREAVAVALACGADFVRVENFVFAHVADEGLMPTASAAELLRYRRQIGALHVKIFADIKKKHASHALTADLSIAETARAAEFFGADGVVVTGTATAMPVNPSELQAVRAAVQLPVWVGSGVTPENLPQLWPHSSGLIVGSYFKHGGDWRNHVDSARVRTLVEAVRRLQDSPTGCDSRG